MVKKITKYAKFLVCCALILSLIAPSYAALSASDGSAFITKAEFDSALADFNARLTTFEAGINSKIDSQVTSYLDRNGIWNGKDQTLNSAYWYPDHLTSGGIDNSCRFGWLAGIGFTSQYGDEHRYNTCPYLFKTDKAGLLYLSVNLSSYNSYDTATSFPATETGNLANTALPRGIVMIWSTENSDNGRKATITFSAGVLELDVEKTWFESYSGTLPGSYNRAATLIFTLNGVGTNVSTNRVLSAGLLPTMSCVWMLFVSRDKYIVPFLSCDCVGGNFNNTLFAKGTYAGTRVTGFYSMAMGINDAKIY